VSFCEVLRVAANPNDILMDSLLHSEVDNTVVIWLKMRGGRASVDDDSIFCSIFAMIIYILRDGMPLLSCNLTLNRCLNTKHQTPNTKHQTPNKLRIILWLITSITLN
jgi:hypothetical protein